MRNSSRDDDEKAEGNHQAELDAALTRALAVTLNDDMRGRGTWKGREGEPFFLRCDN